jgi:hypothetical protein
MKLPKLYAPVTIEFSSLRDTVGYELGVIHDVDTMVTRKARRVLTAGSNVTWCNWKWQIVSGVRDMYWDWPIYTDQEILDDGGEDMSGIKIL